MKKTWDKYNNIPFTYPGVSKHDNREVADLRTEAPQLHRPCGVQTGYHLRRRLLQVSVAGELEQPSEEYQHQRQ